MTMQPEIPWLVPRVQVMTRHKTYPQAEAFALSVFNSLVKVNNVNLPPSNKLYAMIQPINTPALFRRDDENRTSFVFNIEVPKEQ